MWSRIFNAPPLVVAQVLGRLCTRRAADGRRAHTYILAFAGVWLAGEVAWRLDYHSNTIDSIRQQVPLPATKERSGALVGAENRNCCRRD